MVEQIGKSITSAEQLLKALDRLESHKYYQIIKFRRHGIAIQQTPVIPEFVVKDKIDELRKEQVDFLSSYREGTITPNMFYDLLKINVEKQECLREILKKKEGGE